MTLSIGTMLTSCRERAIGEIDPMLPTDFVGFWWRDAQNTVQEDGTVKTWLPHGSYSNSNRTLSAIPGGSERLPTFRNGWIESSSTYGSAEAGFVLSDRAGQNVLSPSLTMTRPNQTKLYLRFNTWVTTGTVRTLYQTHWVDEESNSVAGLTVTQDRGAIRVEWTPTGWQPGDALASATLDSTGRNSVWIWTRVLFEKDKKVVIEMWDTSMGNKLAEVSAPFTSFAPAHSTAKHYVMRGGENTGGNSSLFFKDFGFGTDFNMPPEPRVTSTDAPDSPNSPEA